MDEKAKNAITEILQSDDMRAYFEDMLSGQTAKILSAIKAKEENGVAEKIYELKKKLEKEQEKNKSLLLKTQEAETERARFEELYEDKKRACEEVQHRKTELEEQATILRKQNEQLSLKLKEQKKQADVELQAIKAEKESAVKKSEAYEAEFACSNLAYSSYKSLPENIKSRIGNIFRRDNIYSFIVATGDLTSIEGLWSFTKRRIIEDEREGTSELVDLFESAFALYNKIDGSGKYELISPNIGERFDSDRHSIKGTKTDGQIQKVLLKGIFDNTTKKAVFKAVVQVQ